MWDYYTEAVQRSLWAAWDWAVGQGLWLTFWIAVAAAASDLLRRLHGRWKLPTERNAVVKDIGKKALIDLAGTPLLFLVAVFLWFFIHDAPEQIRLGKEQVKSASSASTAEISRLNGEILRLSSELMNKKVNGFYVECHKDLSPPKYGVNGRMYVLNVLDGEDLGTDEMTGAPDSPLNIGDDNKLSRVSQCTITNDTDEALFAIELRPVVANIKTTVRPDGAMEGHGIDRQRLASVYIPRLDPGTQNAFTFYFINFALSVVDVTMPSSVIAHCLGATEPDSFPLISNVPWVSLSPRVPTKATSH